MDELNQVKTSKSACDERTTGLLSMCIGCVRAPCVLLSEIQASVNDG